MVKVLNAAEFDALDKKGVVLLDFYADWCGPCQQLGPVLDELSNEMTDVVIVKLNVDEGENKSFALKHRVLSIPTLLLFKDGEVIERGQGFMPKDELISFINKAK